MQRVIQQANCSILTFSRSLPGRQLQAEGGADAFFAFVPDASAHRFDLGFNQVEAQPITEFRNDLRLTGTLEWGKNAIRFFGPNAAPLIHNIKLNGRALLSFSCS